MENRNLQDDRMAACSFSTGHWIFLYLFLGQMFGKNIFKRKIGFSLFRKFGISSKTIIENDILKMKKLCEKGLSAILNNAKAPITALTVPLS